MQPLISIVIPVYNRVHLLPLVLGSIKKQTYKNIEIIIIDDGSTEDMENIISYFKNSFPIIYIRQENRGAPSARNRGMLETKGEYVIFWDADVIGKPEMLERLERPLQSNFKLSFSYCNYHLSSITYPQRGMPCGYHLLKKMRAFEFNIEKLNQSNYIHSTSLIRKKDAIKWDESLKRFQDWDLWLTMLEEKKTGVWVDDFLFTIFGGGTMSGWLPRIAYKVPIRWFPFVNKSVFKYEEAKRVIIKKHNLSTPVS
ncbi:MAG: glycosyltransferase family A protein [Candidatus Magasanikbacteria bacterium]